MFRIRDILVRIWILGSVPLTADPDPAPALFVSDRQDANEKLFFFLQIFLLTYYRYFLKVHLLHSSQIKKVTKKSQTVEIEGFLIFA